MSDSSSRPLPILDSVSTDHAVAMDDGDSLFGTGLHIKQTTSLCPVCLEPIQADVFERGQGVYMDKSCQRHGRYTALLASDAQHYYVADPMVESEVCCCGPNQHCGDQVANHSCNMLFEITQSCNLTCPTCYAGSSPQNKSFVSLKRFEHLLDTQIANGKGSADLIQLSGGEPTIHPEFFEILELALAKGIRQVYVNTNGVRLAKADFAARLASYGEKVAVYLQFDGFRPEILQTLRGRGDLLETKLRAADHCEELGLNTVPVMTLTRGVNDDQLGEFIRWASKRPRSVRKVMVQPAIYSGRYENPRFVKRLTLADVAKLLCEQTDGLFIEDDFSPIPCSDPNCFSMVAAIRGHDGLIPISRYLPRYKDWAKKSNRDMIAAVSDTFDSAEDLSSLFAKFMGSDALSGLDETSLDGLLDVMEKLADPQENVGTASAWDGMFAIGIKPFMDAFTYDQDRIDKCCVHIISADGTPVSFCQYNALNRPQGNL